MNVLSQFGLAQPRSEVPPTGGGTAAGILGQFGLAPLGRPPPPPPPPPASRPTISWEEFEPVLEESCRTVAADVMARRLVAMYVDMHNAAVEEKKNEKLRKAGGAAPAAGAATEHAAPGTPAREGGRAGPAQPQQALLKQHQHQHQHQHQQHQQHQQPKCHHLRSSATPSWTTGSS